jgi:hypothetical protein
MTGREFQLGDTVACSYRNSHVYVGAITRIAKYPHGTIFDVTDHEHRVLVFKEADIKLIKEAASDASD